MENYSLDNLNKAASSNGLIIGIIGTVFGLAIYYAAPQMMASMWLGIAMFVFFLVVYIFFTLDLRKKIGGFWTFRQALQGIFLMGVVSTLISSVFNYVFYKFIEPGAYEKVSTMAVDNARSTYEGMGMNEDQIDQAIVQVEKSLKAQLDPTIGECLTNIGIALIFGFIMALIFAAIFKKNPPAFQPQADDNN